MMRWCDSARYYNTAQMLRKFSSLNNDAVSGCDVSVQSSGGRGNGACIKISSAHAYYTGATRSTLSKVLDAQATWIIGYRWKISALNTVEDGGPIFQLIDGSTVHLELRIDSNGLLYLYRGDGTQLASSSTQVIFIGTLMYIELKATIADSGSAVVHVNGNPCMSFTGDTRNGGNASANVLRWIGPYNSADTVATYICDIYAADGQTGQVTDFLGPQRVDPFFFTEDGYYTDFTPSTGDNRYSLIDENPANDDTDYISQQAGHKFTVKTITIPHNPLAINAVQPVYTMRHDDAGVCNAKRLLRKSSTDYESSGNLTSPDVSYQQILDILEVDPATSAKFTKTDLQSNIEWGLRTL